VDEHTPPARTYQTEMLRPLAVAPPNDSPRPFAHEASLDDQFATARQRIIGQRHLCSVKRVANGTQQLPTCLRTRIDQHRWPFCLNRRSRTRARHKLRDRCDNKQATHQA